MPNSTPMNIDKNEFRKYAVKHHRIGSQHVDSFVARVEQSAIPMSMTPYIIEERQLNVAQMDVFSRLMMDRIIFLGDAIYDNIANIIQAQLLFLQSTDAKRDIQIYINSPGGSVTAGLAIYDTMQFVKNDIVTYCVGQAASMGALLLTAGTKGKRFALPNARIMIHQPSGGAQGQASDIEISYKEIQRLKDILNQMLATHTGQTLKKIQKDSDRDYFMSSLEAMEYGLIDKVLNNRPLA